MSTRRQDRKAVRKANRIAAIDQEKPKRNFRKVVVIIVAAIFVVVESFLLLSSKVHYDYDESVKVAEEMTIQLSMINTSLQTGNKALFEESLTNFREQLNLFEGNEYVKKNNLFQLHTIANVHDNVEKQRSGKSLVIQIIVVCYRSTGGDGVNI